MAAGIKKRMTPARNELRLFRRRLLCWFRRNRRDLPWRRTRDAYRIWLSEIMLQQTRVAAVLPYYRRFVRRFPTVRALARAPTEEVLQYWAGLGYYSRARNLHRAAKEIVKRHAGRFPSELTDVLALPGIGRYTARAILSIVHGAPLAVLDGNVARVLTRLDAIRGDSALRETSRWERLQGRAQQLLPVSSPGDWNQAMMELGATVCTPRAPRCEICPLARWCRACALGIADELPERRRKRPTVRLRIAAAVLIDAKKRTLLVRPPGKLAGLFSRMWQFPAVEVTGDGAAKLAAHLQQEIGVATSELSSLSAARHTVTFREITLAPFLIEVPQLPKVAQARQVPLSQIALGPRQPTAGLPVSNATRKIGAAAWEHLSSAPPQTKTPPRT